MKKMKALRRLVALVVLLAVAAVLSGMSSLEEGVPHRIPEPTQNFAGVVVDQSDVRTRLTMLSINGFTYLLGKKGQGNLAVPFESLTRVDFRLKETDLEAVAHFKDGRTITLRADRHQDCYGRTEFGNFRIKLGDVKTLIFEGRLVPAAEAR